MHPHLAVPATASILQSYQIVNTQRKLNFDMAKAARNKRE
jgi:hypothetical protein